MTEEINIIDCIKVLKKRFLILVLVFVLFMALGVIYCKVATPIYTATSTLLTVGGEASLGSGLLAAGAMVGFPLGMQSMDQPSASLPFFLRTRTYRERLVERMNLRQVFFKDRWDEQTKQWRPGVQQPTVEQTAAMLNERVDLVVGETNKSIMALVTENEDPELALRINKFILKDLQAYMNENAFTKNKRQRIYVEEQLLARRKELIQLGKELSDYHQKNQISAVSSTLDVNLADDLMSFNVTTDDPESPAVATPDIDKKIEALEKIKVKNERRMQNTSIDNVPGHVYIDYLNKKKVILLEIHALLANKYEIAKMDEAKEELTYQIIDEARLPTSPDKPKVRLTMMLAGCAGTLGGLLMAFFVEWASTQKFS
ncbi:MAG: hypothetical protein HQM16_07890 [Deltaproteobacteria bacterium]|nr:hypothetical protein [Deltaproteobacteria bacterium]